MYYKFQLTIANISANISFLMLVPNMSTSLRGIFMSYKKS